MTIEAEERVSEHPMAINGERSATFPDKPLPGTFPDKSLPGTLPYKSRLVPQPTVPQRLDLVDDHSQRFFSAGRRHTRHTGQLVTAHSTVNTLE